MTTSAALVLTTISDPVLLEGYVKNFETYGHLNQVRAYLIADEKTPATCYDRCASLARRGLQIECLNLEQQESFLSHVGNFGRLVPRNSDNRRNVGFLKALESGADFLISIDDDNYCPAEEDFFAEHSIVCSGERELEISEAPEGWFNICDMLELDPPLRVFPRGFPYHARRLPPGVTRAKRKGLISVNAGLWTEDPDLDALTWLVAPVSSVACRTESVVLGERSWSPVNTQNTALNRDVIVAYYFVRMGHVLQGLPIDRYGDIFSGYFTLACLKALNHYVRFGTPVARHQRNTHDHFKDASQELACIWILEDFTAWLVEAGLRSSGYREAYLDLSHRLEEAVERFSGHIWTNSTRAFFHATAYSMRQWVAACDTVLGAG